MYVDCVVLRRAGHRVSPIDPTVAERSRGPTMITSFKMDRYHPHYAAQAYPSSANTRGNTYNPQQIEKVSTLTTPGTAAISRRFLNDSSDCIVKRSRTSALSSIDSSPPLLTSNIRILILFFPRMRRVESLTSSWSMTTVSCWICLSTSVSIPGQTRDQAICSDESPCAKQKR